MELALLEGLVQNDWPLTLQHIHDRMRRVVGDAVVVSVLEPGNTESATYAEVAERADRLAAGLAALGEDETGRRPFSGLARLLQVTLHALGVHHDRHLCLGATMEGHGTSGKAFEPPVPTGRYGC